MGSICVVLTHVYQVNTICLCINLFYLSVFLNGRWSDCYLIFIFYSIIESMNVSNKTVVIGVTWVSMFSRLSTLEPYFICIYLPLLFSHLDTSSFYHYHCYWLASYHTSSYWKNRGLGISQLTALIVPVDPKTASVLLSLGQLQG